MPETDSRIDAYIEKAPEYARPILERIRRVVHKASPEIEEKIKWGMPYFDYKGMLCGMAAFKNHCAFGFWKGSIMQDEHGILETVGKTAMGNLGNITSLKDLPSDRLLISYIKQAMRLNDEGIKVDKAPPKKAAAKLEVSEYFNKELKKNKAALKTFQNFSFTNQKEYVEWVTEAKTEATRDKRMADAVAWMAEGKIRHWKYMQKKA